MSSSRPDTIIVHIDNPHLPGFALASSINAPTLKRITMQRHPEKQDTYGAPFSGTTDQMSAAGFIESLNKNDIPYHLITREGISYSATVEVEGAENIDKLIALSERTTAMESLIRKKTGGMGLS